MASSEPAGGLQAALRASRVDQRRHEGAREGEAWATELAVVGDVYACADDHVDVLGEQLRDAVFEAKLEADSGRRRQEVDDAWGTRMLAVVTPMLDDAFRSGPRRARTLQLEERATGDARRASASVRDDELSRECGGRAARRGLQRGCKWRLVVGKLTAAWRRPPSLHARRSARVFRKLVDPFFEKVK